jgi:PBP1b-binding outer membrane lipoprotein LpoB
MKLTFLLTIILLSSCLNVKDPNVNRQKAIQKEMEQVKADYFKKTDTSYAKQLEIAKESVSADENKNSRLIKLQKEYDSLEAKMKK